jgi:DNA-binding beta-propeller fold protein YncE
VSDVSTATKICIALAALAATPIARADLALVSRNPIYADPKGVAFRAPEGVGCSATALVVADTGNGRLVAYDFKDGSVGGGSEVKLAQVTYPTRVQLDGQGNILVLDRKAKRIARLDAKGGFKGWVDPKGAAGVIPGAFKVDGADGLYVLDLASHSVLGLDGSGTVTRRIQLPRSNALFTDLTVDAAGTLYLLDAQGKLVWSVEKGGTEVKPLSKSLKDSLNFPGYITTDGKGVLYVVDQNGNGLVLLGIDGSYLGRRLAIGWTEGTVYYPAQLCVSPGGEVVLADRGNNRVQLFSLTR